jgi:hypothetical protein
MNLGDYVHFDWIESISSYLAGKLESKVTEVNISVNIDGIPLYNNSRFYTAYPILIKILQCPSEVFTAAIFCTNKEQKGLPSAQIFLKPFLNDVKNHENILLNGRSVKLILGPFICDAPIRSYLKGIVNHTAYDSCERCIQKGEYHGGHVALVKVNCPLRSFQSFKDKTDGKHHRLESISPLDTELEFDMVGGFVLDYMHMCTIGVMKRMLTRLSTSKGKTIKAHFSVAQKNTFEKVLSNMRQHLPSDFPRKFESGFQYMSRWKSSEMRLFMLYVGVVVFNNVTLMSKEMYANFLLFSVSMRILLSNGMQQNMPMVSEMLKLFTKQSAVLFGKEFISYNVHSITHLPDDYNQYGNLENISCFPFESYLGAHIKSPVRSGYKPLNQIAGHVLRKNNTFNDEHFSIMYSNVLRETESEVFYKKLVLKLTKITAGELGDKDNTIQLIDGSIAIIKAIAVKSHKVHLDVHIFGKVKNLFKLPLKSKTVGIYKVKSLREELVRIDFNQYSCKLVLLPHGNSFVAMKMIHTT